MTSMSPRTHAVSEPPLAARIGELEERFSSLLRDGAGMSRADVESVRDTLARLRQDAVGLEEGPELLAINAAAAAALEKVEAAATSLAVARTALSAAMLSPTIEANHQVAYWLSRTTDAVADAMRLAGTERDR